MFHKHQSSFHLFLICIDFTGKYKIKRFINAFGVHLVIFKNLAYVSLVRQAALIYTYIKTTYSLPMIRCLPVHNFKRLLL